MTRNNDPFESAIRARTATVVERCERWSELGRYRKILEAIEDVLPSAEPYPDLKNELILWKAYALGSMGFHEQAYAAAALSWELEPSPHAAHIMALSLIHSGENEHAEEILRFGLQHFPDAPHLVLQLALLLIEEGRHPEAMDLLDESETWMGDADESMIALHTGIRAHLLAETGRWEEALTAAGEALMAHPHVSGLRETYESIKDRHDRYRAFSLLDETWRKSLEPLGETSAVAVDQAISAVGASIEVPPLGILAARRLWRRFLDADPVRPRAHEAWAAALLATIVSLDGTNLPLSFFARFAGTAPETVRTAFRRIDAFLKRLPEPDRLREFAVRLNPQLAPAGSTSRESGAPSTGRLLQFPVRGEGKSS